MSRGYGKIYQNHLFLNKTGGFFVYFCLISEMDLYAKIKTEDSQRSSVFFVHYAATLSTV